MNIKHQMDTADEGDDVVPVAPRGLKITVYVMGVLLVVGFIAVFSTIIYRTVNMESNPATARWPVPAVWSIEAALPAGARILEMIQADQRLSVRYDSDAGPGIMVFDIKTGHQLGQIGFAR